MEQDNEKRSPFEGNLSRHPVAIIEDRYSGAHCGGAWIAVGTTPQEAHDNLLAGLRPHASAKAD